jgi:hypothetical protein
MELISMINCAVITQHNSGLFKTGCLSSFGYWVWLLSMLSSSAMKFTLILISNESKITAGSAFNLLTIWSMLVRRVLTHSGLVFIRMKSTHAQKGGTVLVQLPRATAQRAALMDMLAKDMSFRWGEKLVDHTD